MTETWDFLQSPAADAATNMAVDEALLLEAAQRELPLLRVYSWARPAVSIGYFQKFPAHLAGTYEIVRRPTGGGLVYHGDDTTYTVVVPPSHRVFRLPVSDAYCIIHKAVAAALDMQANLFDESTRSPRGSYRCFESPVQGDVVAGGRKLAGGAQRRTRWGLLHQGSIAVTLSAEDLEQGFRKHLAAEFRVYELSETERALADKLAREKYSAVAWNQRHRTAELTPR